jgi:dodecin
VARGEAARGSACEAPHKRRKLRCQAPCRGPSQGKGKIMTVARITEISSVSDKSFQDAIVQGVERANKTLKNVKGAWVKDQEVTIENGKVTGYKVILKVTFVLED